MPRHPDIPRPRLSVQRFAAALAGSLVLSVTSSRAADDPVAQFERDVRPVLEKRCWQCHGAEKQENGLRLDRRAGLLAGGDSEKAALVPGKSGEGEIIRRVTTADAHDVMPPKGERLTAEEIAALKRWIDAGAHWPDSAATAAADAGTGPQVTDKDRAFWSFQTPQRSEPDVKGDGSWPRQRLDRFILARLQSEGLEPAREASTAVLVRRLTFDLTGLPPVPEEVEAFVKACAHGDPSTLNSALSTLTDRLLASPRFGERMASLWLPLARFAEDQAHQVGSDTKFFYPNAHLYRAWVIAAFNRDLPYDQFLKLQLAADKLPETAEEDLAALGFLGLGPKYYNRNRLEVMADEWEDRVDTVSRTMLGLTVACARCHDHKFDPVSTRDYYALAGIFASTRMMNRKPDGSAEKEDTKADKMDPATLHVVRDGDLQNLNVFIRGNVEQKGPVVERGFIEVLQAGAPQPYKEGSGRRELAEAIASRSNPLTARVIVNRVWAAMFGRPLVVTPSNFGRSGERPSHPELLDDLAVRFMENGWSIKTLVKEIALSATYRQSTFAAPEKVSADPDNHLLSRMHRRRLAVEQWRDTVLAVSGELVEAPGAKSQPVDDPGNHQRTVYACVSRLQLNALLLQFDYPDANVHAERRPVTTTAMQKLFVLNSPFMQTRAAALATRLMAAAPGDDAARITFAYRLLFSREPDDDERALARNFLSNGQRPAAQRWEEYAQVLLASNELLYVD
jgi:mono/diheme cytochrome c family protein